MLMTARMTNPAFAVAARARRRARRPGLQGLTRPRHGCVLAEARPASPALVLDIATVNLWNRLNIATQQVVGEAGG